jgi:CheY-like chemotaxis protein
LDSRDNGERNSGSWTRAGGTPERWERPGYGSIVAYEPDLWSCQPVCGHDHYLARTVEEAMALAEERSGLCFVCWKCRLTRGRRFESGVVPVVRPPSESDRTSRNARHAPIVLVVDDDADTREALTELLEDHGYMVLGAANGVEAFDLINAGSRPSMILLDLMMPFMDGYRFRTEQRRSPVLAAIPVVVITAGTPAGEHELDLAEVLQKPLEVPRLLDSIEHHCRHQQRLSPS